MGAWVVKYCIYVPFVKGITVLITPLESALTRNSPVSLLESALAERGGWGYNDATSKEKL